MSLINKKTYQAGEIIYKKDDPAHTVFMIKSGHVDLSQGSDKTNIIKTVSNGHLFGELELSAKGPRQETARATSSLDCVAISVDELNKRIESQDPFIAALFRILVGNLNTASTLKTHDKNTMEVLSNLSEEKE